MKTDFLKNSKILIVDDTPANIEVLDALLAIEGYKNISKTTDPREVIDLYLKFEPDLILLDLNMPYMSGFEVMEQLQQMVNHQIYLPILVLTADASDATKKKALAAGASDFLSKPFDLVEVSLRIENLLYTNYLYSQVRNQNLMLEEKVKERTKELEDKNIQLKKAWELADAANRLKQAFLNNISHEIRTPLNGIIGFSHLLTDPAIGFNEKSDYLKIMQESSNRLINTVTSFLDISLLNSGNMECILTPVRPEFILFEAYEKYLQLCVKKKIDIEVITDKLPDDFVFVSDENMIQKILENLVDNAVKFTEEGKIEIGAEIIGSQIRFFVIDSGIGISADFGNRIFISFNQENENITRNHEGLGLGLSISKGLVELLGGQIGYNPNPDGGTSFFFTIPLRTEDNAELKTEEVLKDIEKSYKILVVEDDETNYYLLFFFLSGSNIEIIHAPTGQEAISIFKESNDFDLVLMDLKLPDIDGFQVTREIKSINSITPVIAVTAYSGNNERQLAYQSGCNDIIIKPINKPVLIDKISKYIKIKPVKS